MSLQDPITGPSRLNQRFPDTVNLSQLPIFESYPYLITRIVPALYHIILLPGEFEREKTIEISLYQARMNKLQTCLVFSAADCIYFSPNDSQNQCNNPPRGGIIVSGCLKPYFDFHRDAAWELREKELQKFCLARKKNGFLMGDLSKGGRPASNEELTRLAGFQSNGIPVGLSQCPACGDWRGRCLDPNPRFAGLVMEVYCPCDNDNRCAACGELMGVNKLNSNQYYPKDGQIWHNPGFAALTHKCSGDVR